MTNSFPHVVFAGLGDEGITINLAVNDLLTSRCMSSDFSPPQTRDDEKHMDGIEFGVVHNFTHVPLQT